MFQNVIISLKSLKTYNGIESLSQTHDIIIPISLQHNIVDLRYFKQRILLDQII